MCSLVHMGIFILIFPVSVVLYATKRLSIDNNFGQLLYRNLILANWWWHSGNVLRNCLPCAGGDEMMEARVKEMRAGQKIWDDMATIVVLLLQRLNIDRLGRWYHRHYEIYTMVILMIGEHVNYLEKQKNKVWGKFCFMNIEFNELLSTNLPENLVENGRF